MKRILMRVPLFAAAGLVAAVFACADGESVPPTPEPTPIRVATQADVTAKDPEASLTPSAAPHPTPEPEPTPAPTAAPASTPAPTPELAPTPPAYDSNAAMYDIFPGFTTSMQRALDALERVKANEDDSMIPVLIEIMRFMPSQSSRDSVADTLQTLTGQPFAGNDWDEWMDWMGQNLDDIEPPDSYADWKAALYSFIDERFAYFLRPARDFSRIRLEEVVWGGVRPDGIPDLRGPSFVEADEADYMNPDDRVFGLEINGDARAYPLRVVNAHEMVNDSVGGEPISLMW